MPPTVRGTPERALRWSSAALLILCASIVALAIRDARHVAAVLEDIRTTKRPLAETAYEVEIDALELASSVDAYVWQRDPRALEDFRVYEARFRSVVERYARLAKTQGQDSLSGALASLAAQYDTAAQRLIASRARARVPLPRDSAVDALNAVESRLDALLDTQVQPRAISNWHAAADEARATSARTAAIIVILAPLVLLVGIVAVRVPVRAYAREREARESLERISQEKTEFAAITAHELRSPLTGMLGSLRLMKSGRAGPLPETAVPYVDVASRNAAHLLNLINDLLDLDRIEAGMMPFKRDPVSPATLLSQTVEALSGMASELEVQLATSNDATRSVTGDASRLQQVLVNLVSNALKHAPARSTVTIAAVDRGADVRFTVHDDGPGIAPADRQRIFQRFVQTGSASQHPSTGLGLTIAREIVLRHGGRIGVESEPEHGATFWFELKAS